MLTMFRKIILIAFFIMLTTNAFASVGYIKHKFINDTGNDYYVTIRQQFLYPIDACQGVVAAGKTKECEGSFELDYPTFLLSFILNLRSETSVRSEIRNADKSQSLMVTWILKLDDKNSLTVRRLVNSM